MSQSGAIVRELSQKEDKCERKYTVMRELSQKGDKCERKYTVVREMSQKEDKRERKYMVMRELSQREVNVEKRGKEGSNRNNGLHKGRPVYAKQTSCVDRSTLFSLCLVLMVYLHWISLKGQSTVKGLWTFCKIIHQQRQSKLGCSDEPAHLVPMYTPLFSLFITFPPLWIPQPCDKLLQHPV